MFMNRDVNNGVYRYCVDLYLIIAMTMLDVTKHNSEYEVCIMAIFIEISIPAVLAGFLRIPTYTRPYYTL